MAPWPEQGTEPKAPDKDEKRDLLEEVAKSETVESQEQAIPTPSNQSGKQLEEKDVISLSEGGLKTLLDEAIAYKNPRDRVGKSNLFQELLEEAEADESDNKGLGSSFSAKLPRGCHNLSVRKRQPRHQGRECGVGVSTTRGGSLQNLHALAMGGGRRRSGRNGETLVSARQREGGSLPSNVNVDNDSDLDRILCPNYTSRATLEVSGPCKEDFGNVDDPINLSLLQGVSTPVHSEAQLGLNHNFTKSPGLATITKEEENDLKFSTSMNVSKLESGAVLYPTNPSGPQHVSMFNIPPPQIHIGPDPNSRVCTFAKDPDPKVRSWDVDQNQNSVGCMRMDSNCIDKKKQRRLKMKSDENYILAENIEGFRGRADIDTLMEYIESPSTKLDINKSTKTRTNQSNGPRNHVKVRAKEEDSRPIKRRTKEKFQRCNSLEEISKTKLEDLTEESSSEKVNGSQQTLTNAQESFENVQQNKKFSVGGDSQIEETDSVINHIEDQNKERTSPDPIQDSEFHVVMKRQRKKKRRSGYSARVGSKQSYYSGRGFPAHDRTLGQDGTSGLLYQYRSRGDKASFQTRRKSASSVPPSDKSDSSDLDSVHSLPVSSTTSRTKVGKNSVSGGSTPQASYADIARSIPSPPDIEHGKYLPCLLSTGPDYDMSSSNHHESSVKLPPPLAYMKKNAMTETTCDIVKPPLPNEEFPPLEVKTDLHLDYLKQSRNTTMDNKNFQFVTKTAPYVIPISESEIRPRSTVVDLSTSSIKSLVDPDSKRPPVILMDEPSVNSQIPSELTFGFEVNEQLLQCEESVCNSNFVRPQQFSCSDLPHSFVPNSYWDDVIDYLQRDWDDTMKDLALGRAKYYDGSDGQ